MSQRAAAGVGLALALALGPGPGPATSPALAADDFPARALGKPFFLADVEAFPADDGKLDVTVVWEIPVAQLVFRQELGYYRARYDVSVVCLRKDRQVGGDVWERRVRLDDFSQTRDPSRFARGEVRLRIPAGDFDARIEVRDRQGGLASRVQGHVEGDTADLRIALGDVSLVRYTEEGVEPNPGALVRLGESGNRVRTLLHPASGVSGDFRVRVRIAGPENSTAETDSLVQVTGGDVLLDLRLPVDDLGPGRHRLEVEVDGMRGGVRVREIDVRPGEAWFRSDRDRTLEIVGIVAPEERASLAAAHGEDAWRTALDDFWSRQAARHGPDFRERLEESIALAVTWFREPFHSHGWLTDRGKVLLRRGRPDRRSVRPPGDEVPASELWEYDSPPARFLFVDYAGTGEFFEMDE
ncbi:MAG: GWxTD domain-containing protein [bacterium]